MKRPALIFAFIAVASVVGYAALTQDRGGETVFAKTSSHPAVKDQSRLPRVGCLLGARDFICEAE